MIISHLISFFMGIALFFLLFKLKKGGFEKLSEEILKNGQNDLKKKEAAFNLKLQEKEFEFYKHFENKSLKFDKREEKLDRQLEIVEKKLSEMSKKEKKLEKVEEREKKITQKEKDVFEELEKISTLTQSQAESLLFEKLSKEITAHYIVRKKKEAEEEGERQAAKIIATAINRLSLPTVCEVAITTVTLPNQEMKGRVIGREGRNIRALEQATGVTFAVDDTPNTILISGFDPIRKEIAKQALKALLQDGRIHPTRIEEVVAKTREKMDSKIKEFGEDAAMQASTTGLHPELIKLLGMLQFRFSCGQNVLQHSIEVSYLMGMIANELHLDATLAKRIGLLHDIGKAVSQEVEKSHALIGKEVALYYEESEEVANGIGCHHEEIMPITIEASLCSAANRISGARPGARVESLELYLKRIKRLEQISSQFDGVENAYALQAGKEIRVIVEPEKFDDAGATDLARLIAKKIEHELSYPGKIKVTVIREKKAIEYAT